MPGTTYLVFLRAVMPSGKNKLPMAALRDVLSQAGFGDVRTTIQSGNALVDTDLPAREVETRIRTLIKERIGPDLAVVVRTREQVQAVLDACPFYERFAPSRLFFVLFADTPDPAKGAALLAQHYGEEALAIVGNAAYMFIPGVVGRHTLSTTFL